MATVHNVGVQVKSQYLPEVATVFKSQHLVYGLKSLATNVPVHVVYQQLLASWQLSVGMVGLPVKSQYLPVVATVHKSHVLTYGCKSFATKVPVQVVYQQLFHNWQLSVGISQHLA